MNDATKRAAQYGGRGGFVGPSGAIDDAKVVAHLLVADEDHASCLNAAEAYLLTKGYGAATRERLLRWAMDEVNGCGDLA